jgi:hypothetical protein
VVTIFSGLASKSLATIFSALDSKSVAMISLGLALKPVVSFLIEPQNQGGGGFLDLGIKIVSYGFVIWASKSPRQFGGLGLKISTTVFWFVPQNQASFGLSTAPQNRWREFSVGHASRFSGLIRVKASQARVFQSDLKTGGGVTAGGARDTIAEVMLESS